MVCVLRLNNDKKCKSELASCLGRMSANRRTAHDALVHHMQIHSRFSRESRGFSQHRRLTPLVRSKTWSGTRQSLGLTSSLKPPTALNAATHLTPNFLSAAILALDSTLCGTNSWYRPCLERNTTMRGVPVDLRYERIVMGDEGVPHGVCWFMRVRRSMCMCVYWLNYSRK